MESLYTGSLRRWIIEDGNGESFYGGEQYPAFFKHLLCQRGVTSPEDAERYLAPDIRHLHDPFLMKGMERAAARVVRAIERKESVLVYGDYDVDGVSATAILVRFLRSVGLNTDFYIPDRVEEGYGISDASVDVVCSSGFDLMITVDCGITAREQTDAIYERCLAGGKPLDIIVTDHHQCQEDLLPQVYAIVNPHLPDCTYPFKYLCGAGIALKLVQAVGILTGKPDAYKSYLDLAALATIADIVDLTDENRVIARLGIEKMNGDCCLGIKALAESAGISLGTIDSRRVAFMLAPRVNAAGRMGDAKRAVNLFITGDPVEARSIAEELNRNNSLRQEVQDAIFSQAVKMIEAEEGYQNNRVTVAWGEGWHHGVVGIVASKLVDRYHKPAFVFSVENGMAVGSGRSIPGYNLFQCMASQSDLLIKFGGHELAGGLTMAAENIQAFKEGVNRHALENMTEEMTEPSIHIHSVLEPGDITLENARRVSLLEPFGQGNPVPVFLVNGVAITNKCRIGDGKHLKLRFNAGRGTVDAVFFGQGELEKYIRIGDRMDIVFNLAINVWQGAEYLQVRILDMRMDEATVARNRFLMEAARRFESLDCDYDWLYNGINNHLVKADDITIQRDDLAAVYRYVTKNAIERMDVTDLFWHARQIADESGRRINYYKLLLSLLIFDELQLMDFSIQEDGSYLLRRYENTGKVNLEDSELFSYLQENTRLCG